MKSNFLKAYDRIRIYEGGNDDDPQDPGGRTSRGIIQRVYDGYRTRKGLPKRDVWKATEAEVREIYEEQYWDAVRGNELPSGVDLFVYDGAVNSGPSQSIKWLQRALGVKADGNLGNATMGALQANTDNDALIASMADQRRKFLRALKHYPRFGKGWERRVNSAESIGQAWASGRSGPQPVYVEELSGNKKAKVEDAAEPMVSQETGMATTATTSAGAGIVDTIQNSITTLQGFDSIKYVKYALIALAIAAFCITIYSIWKTSKVKDATS